MGLIEERQRALIEGEHVRLARMGPGMFVSPVFLGGAILVLVLIGALAYFGSGPSNPTTSVRNDATSAYQQNGTISDTAVGAQKFATDQAKPTAAPAEPTPLSPQGSQLSVGINKLDGIICKSGQLVNISVVITASGNDIAVSYEIGSSKTTPVTIKPGGEHFQDVVTNDPALPNEPHPCGIIVHWNGGASYEMAR